MLKVTRRRGEWAGCWRAAAAESRGCALPAVRQVFVVRSRREGGSGLRSVELYKYFSVLIQAVDVKAGQAQGGAKGGFDVE